MPVPGRPQLVSGPSPLGDFHPNLPGKTKCSLKISHLLSPPFSLPFFLVLFCVSLVLLSFLPVLDKNCFLLQQTIFSCSLAIYCHAEVMWAFSMGFISFKGRVVLDLKPFPYSSLEKQIIPAHFQQFGNIPIYMIYDKNKSGWGFFCKQEISVYNL